MKSEERKQGLLELLLALVATTAPIAMTIKYAIAGDDISRIILVILVVYLAIELVLELSYRKRISREQEAKENLKAFATYLEKQIKEKGE